MPPLGPLKFNQHPQPLLDHLWYPCQLSDMAPCFSCLVPKISLILAEVTDDVDNNQGHLIQDLNQP